MSSPFTKHLLGHSVTVKVTPEGRVTEVQGLDNLVKRELGGMDDPNAAQESREASAFLKKSLRQSFDEFFKKVMAIPILPYPAEPVGVNQTWPYQMVDSGSLPLAALGDFPLSIKGTRTLAARRNGMVTIKSKANLVCKLTTGPLSLQPVQMILNLKGTQTGSGEIDESTGCTRSSSMSRRLSGTIRTKDLSTTGTSRPFDSPLMPFYSKTDVIVTVTPIASPGAPSAPSTAPPGAAAPSR